MTSSKIKADVKTVIKGLLLLLLLFDTEVVDIRPNPFVRPYIHCKYERKKDLTAELYDIGGTATIITEGFCFEARNESCVKEVDGRLMATKFGLYTRGPGLVKEEREFAKERSDDCYDRIRRNVKLELYYDRKYYGNKYYIPTTIDTIFPEHDDYAVYDTERSQIYSVSYEERGVDTYNLIGIGVDTVQKVDSGILSSNIRDRYIPLIEINTRQS